MVPRLPGSFTPSNARNNGFLPRIVERKLRRKENFLLFDFDRFAISVKLAYRRCSGSAYSLEEVRQVFRYYFETYEMIFDTAHPVISIAQIARIIDRMPFVLDGEYESRSMSDISPEDYEVIIDQHFATRYKRGCDYNINHFFSGQIRDLRYYEVLY